jgi:hypothetical protein
MKSKSYCPYFLRGKAYYLQQDYARACDDLGKSKRFGIAEQDRKWNEELLEMLQHSCNRPTPSRTATAVFTARTDANLVQTPQVRRTRRPRPTNTVTATTTVSPTATATATPPPSVEQGDREGARNLLYQAMAELEMGRYKTALFRLKQARAVLPTQEAVNRLRNRTLAEVAFSSFLNGDWQAAGTWAARVEGEPEEPWGAIAQVVEELASEAAASEAAREVSREESGSGEQEEQEDDFAQIEKGWHALRKAARAGERGDNLEALRWALLAFYRLEEGPYRARAGFIAGAGLATIYCLEGEQDRSLQRMTRRAFSVSGRMDPRWRPNEEQVSPKVLELYRASLGR